MTGHQYCSGRLGPEPTAPAPGLPAPRPGHWLRQPRPVEPGACAEPAQVPEAGCRWRPPPRPGPGSHGRGPRESLRWGDGVRTKRGDQGHTDVGDCERAEGAGVAETGTGRGPDEGAHPHGHAGPRPRPAPPQRRPMRRVPGQQVHVLCWERHTCERRPEQTRLCPRQARLPPCRRGCFLAWATRPAEEPGRVRGQSAAGSRGCVCPCALGSPTAALTTPLQRLSLTGRFPVRPQLPAGKRVAKFAE